MGSLFKRMISIPVYSSGSILGPGRWTEAGGWTGPEPILYWSFDNLDRLVLMEGTEQKDYDALTEGKVGHNNPRFVLKFCFSTKQTTIPLFGESYSLLDQHNGP